MESSHNLQITRKPQANNSNIVGTRKYHRLRDIGNNGDPVRFRARRSIFQRADFSPLALLRCPPVLRSLDTSSFPPSMRISRGLIKWIEKRDEPSPITIMRIYRKKGKKKEKNPPTVQSFAAHKEKKREEKKRTLSPTKFISRGISIQFARNFNFINNFGRRIPFV